MHRPVLAVLGLAAVAIGQTAPTSTQDPAPEVTEDVAIAADEPDGPAMHGVVGNDFTSSYFFRGIQQENQGAIAEPYLELGMPLYAGDGEIRSIDLRLGQWNSLHDGPSGSGGAQSMWYENDLYAAVDIVGSERFTLGTVYTNYYSPNSRFGTVQEIAASLSYDDTDLIAEGFGGLQPSVLVAFETSGRADAVGKRGVYLEASIAPTFDLGAIGDIGLTLTVPIKLGLSLDHYYESATNGDSSFGYLDLGAVLGAPLSFLPSRLGHWDGTIGVHALFLGDSNKELNQDDGFEPIVSCGFSTSF